MLSLPSANQRHQNNPLEPLLGISKFFNQLFAGLAFLLIIIIIIIMIFCLFIIIMSMRTVRKFLHLPSQFLRPQFPVKIPHKMTFSRPPSIVCFFIQLFVCQQQELQVRRILLYFHMLACVSVTAVTSPLFFFVSDDRMMSVGCLGSVWGMAGGCLGSVSGVSDGGGVWGIQISNLIDRESAQFTWSSFHELSSCFLAQQQFSPGWDGST